MLKTILILLFVFTYKAVNAQKAFLAQKVSLSYKSVPLREVLSELDSTYPLNFSYYDDSQLDKMVSFDMQGETLEVALEKLFSETGIPYTIKGNHVVLKKKLEKMLLQGKIFDKDTHEPISLAAVSIKGKAVGIVSRPDGQFGLLLPNNYQNDTLYVTMLGYKNYEFSLSALNQSDPINIALETEDKMLREVLILSDAGKWNLLDTKPTRKLSSRSTMGLRSFMTLASLDIPSTDLTLLDLRCGTGILQVSAGNDENIKVEAEIITASLSEKETVKFLTRYLDLSYKTSGDTVFVRSFFNFYNRRKKNRDRFPLGDVMATPGSKINLKVKVPKGLSLKVIDGSGKIRIESLQSDVYLYDGSGGLSIKNVNGNVEVVDGSGSLTVTDVKGNVTLKDHSGEISVKHVYGNLYIKDKSGGVYLDDIANGTSDSTSIFIQDSSGKIYARDIGSNTKIIDGSGGIDIRDVKGTVTINDRSGGINAYDIRDQLKVKDRSGKIHTNKETIDVH
ncbi:MAG: carboxypeptidase-like regulatory domain-containing protein [Bacteroidota bacterium]